MKPVISFTLFGTQMKYYVGAKRNIETISKLLPDWEIRIYYHDNLTNKEYIDELSDYNVNLIDVTNVKVGTINAIEFPYFWRFLSFFEDTPSIVRDLDSRFSEREIQYINSWMNNDKDFFIIRDHPWHSPVPAGLFGIKRKIVSFEEHMRQFIMSNNLPWGTDQTVLHSYMESVDKERIFYCGYDDLTNYIPRDNKDFFIGMQIDEHDKPTDPSAVVALNYLNDINL